MFRRSCAFAGTLLVAATLVFLTPGLSQAQRGSRGGGFRGGGAHVGAAHVGAAHVGAAHVGAYHYGGYHLGGYGNVYRYGGYSPYYRGNNTGLYGFRPYLWGLFGGYPYYGSYAGYPYYSTYGGYPYSYSGLWSGPAYDPGYYSSAYPAVATVVDGATVNPVTPAAYSDPAQDDTRGHVNVTVPADAAVWFDGAPTTTTGTVREFVTPPLTPGNHYTYTVRARWMDRGQEVTQTQRVTVTLGGIANVWFPAPAGTAEPGSAVKSD